MLSLRPATMDDAADLFAWRNDPVSRATSIHTELVEWADHLQWLGKTIASQKRRLLVIESNGVPAATARFDYDDPTEFSVCIAPDYRGQGLSLPMMKLAVSAEPEHVSYVKRTNIACQRLLKAAGLTLERDGEIQTWRYRSCVTSKTLACTGEPTCQHPPPPE